MPTTKTITLYTYDELGDKAKAKARDWCRNISAGDDTYSESIFEDTADIAALMGLDIRQRRVQCMDGSTCYEPAILFSGFCSQGDGACFDGFWRAADVKRGETVKHAPQDTELTRIAVVIEGIAALRPESVFTVKHRGRYYHEHCTEFDIETHPPEDTDDVARTTTEWLAISARENAIAEELKEATRGLMRWTYKELERAYEWTNADEQVADNIRANEYTFTVDGVRED